MRFHRVTSELFVEKDDDGRSDKRTMIYGGEHPPTESAVVSRLAPALSPKSRIDQHHHKVENTRVNEEMELSKQTILTTLATGRHTTYQ
jgi:hypothetical protein